MTIKLFDIQNGVVVPTEACYTLKDLKFIMDEYPEDYMKRYLYLFYMTCPDALHNPFFFLDQSVKEEEIIKQIEVDFSLEEPGMKNALETCVKLYETPISRAFEGIKGMLDELATYMRTTKITTGRDGNGMFLLRAAEKYDDLMASYRGTLRALDEERGTNNRGGEDTAYDG